jgi:hypothetical protein
MAQILDLGKIRFQYKGNWSASTEYQFNDVVTYKGVAYCYISTAKTTGTVTSNATYWGPMTGGFDYGGVYEATTTYAKGSVVRYNGNLYYHSGTTITTNVAPTDTSQWTVLLYQDTSSANVYYVGPGGSDTAGSGRTLAQPFASIKYATQQCGTNATIFVKTGTYSEQLPITVPEYVAIVGDSQRTTFVEPKSGNSDDGTTPNNQATMFLLSNGSILNKMTFKNMTGWVAGSTPGDISTSTPKGMVVAFNSASPIANKSPYVLECVAIINGGVAALVDGTIHSSGARTMVFHEFTVINDNGVGFWMKDGGKAEIVSCFTYYCYFGYAATGGGQIRSLSGNNSYGTWGAYSKGYLATETPLTGVLSGVQLAITSSAQGSIQVGDTVTASSGGTGIVTNTQLAANKIYLKNNTGAFTAGATLTFSSGGTGTIDTAGITGQKGFILVCNGFSSAPLAGSSISLTGDTFSYVVASITGTWVDTTTDMVLLLSQEKPSSSAAGTAVALRKKYSQVRLTGHDFLSVGTGGVTTTNYPNEPLQAASQAKEVVESYPGRVFYTSTDQDGNFRVGAYFKVDQGTGKATLNASAFDLSGLSSLKLGSIGAQLGEQINEFSSDATMSGNSNLAVPTEAAVRGYMPQIATDVTPAVTTTSNIGSTSKRWNNLYAVAGSFTGAVTIGGNLTVSGTTTTIDATTITVADKNIELGKVASPTDITADGGGITIKGATDKTIIWDSASTNWTSSEHWNIATNKSYKINNVAVLTSTALGSTVVNSSLTTLGTLTSLSSSGDIATTSSTASSSTTTGALKVSGGAGIAGALYVGGTHVNTGVISILDTTASASTLTGALKVAGGAGIAGNLYAAAVYDNNTRVLVTGGALGTPSSGTLSSCTVDGTNSVGFLTMPQNSQSASYTTVLSDSGKTILHPASDANARTFTIAANSSVAYPIGTVLQFINMTAQAVTIAINTDTLTWAQGGGSGSRTLSQYGVANVVKVTATQWLLTGTNVT